MRQRVALLALLGLVVSPLPASGWMRCLLGTPNFQATVTLPAGTAAGSVRKVIAERLVGMEGLLTVWEADGQRVTFGGCLPEPERPIMEQLLVPGVLEFAEVLDEEAASVLQPFVDGSAPGEVDVRRSGGSVQASLRCGDLPACERFLADHTPRRGRWMFQRSESSDRFGRRWVSWEALLIGPSAIPGRAVESAKLSNRAYGPPAIQVTLSGKVGKRFGRLTARLVGRRLAMILDGRLVSAPLVRERIDSGRVLLPTDLSPDAARALAAALSTRPLPAGVVLDDFQSE